MDTLPIGRYDMHNNVRMASKQAVKPKSYLPVVIVIVIFNSV